MHDVHCIPLCVNIGAFTNGKQYLCRANQYAGLLTYVPLSAAGSMTHRPAAGVALQMLRGNVYDQLTPETHSDIHWTLKHIILDISAWRLSNTKKEISANIRLTVTFDVMTFALAEMQVNSRRKHD